MISKLGEVCQFLNGGTPSKEVSSYFEGDIPWITSADITGPIVDTARSLITEDAIKNSATNKVAKGTVLLVTRTGVGKVATAGQDLCFSQDITAILPDASKLDSRYLVHFLKTKQKHFERIARGATIKGVTRDVVYDLEIPLPPLPEQRRIAAILDQADALRAKRREALAQLDSLTQSIFIEMFGDPAKNPKGWPTTQLADLITDGDTINYGVVQPGDDADSGIPLIRVGDLIDGRVRHESLKKIAPAVESAYKRSRIRGDEILVSCVGSVGVVALVTEAEKGFNIARAVARVRLSEATNRNFMAAHLQTHSIQHYFTQELRTVSQPTLNIKQLAETSVMCPPIEHQLEFALRLAVAGKVKEAHEASENQLNTLFASLQHRAFRGEL